MLFDWAAKPGGFHRIHFIFPSNNLFHNLNQNPVLMNAYQAMSCNKVVMHSSKIFRNSFSILEILKLAISLWLKCLFGKKLIVLHSDDFLVRFIKYYKVLMPNAQFCRCPKSLNYINKERHTVKTQKFTADHVFVFSEENKCDYELGPGQSYQVIGFFEMLPILDKIYKSG